MFLTCTVIGQSGVVCFSPALGLVSLEVCVSHLYCDWSVWRCVFLTCTVFGQSGGVFLTYAVIGQSGGVCFSPIL